MVDKIIKLVRPSVTGLMAGALVYFTAIRLIKPEIFVPIASIAIVWWYKDHEAEKIRREAEKIRKASEKLQSQYMSNTTPKEKGSLSMVIKTKCPVCGTIIIMKNGRFFHYRDKSKKTS